ncbi:rhodanese-like domain-containing protein [Litorilituus sediminis]|uniref:Rhodanese-like domain-containing protein n=1 Tax=Litorilituus sediminis TaxID=718192 RepID=A0A4P6P6I1_9GAMM|nr:rhodanese-like domain-containing protein [Litorilituus sediminis]QBG37221.1 rhodanese-like domain-containing protein [Litorilituus sediminis]
MLKTIPDIIAQLKPQLTIVPAQQAMDVIKQSNGILVDVREPSEFSQKSASGAVNIPRGLLEMQMLKMHADEDLAIFIHCATGARACLAAEQLQRVGYKNVSVITCSLDDICSASA